MNRILWRVALLLVVATMARAEQVVRVVDGDTIVLSSGERVRYIGVDTPETVHPSRPVQFMGKEASELNRSLVEGKVVRLEYDVERRDRYDRLLAYVYVGDVFVNAELVRRGYAQVMTIPPNVRHAELFLGLQEQARAAETGLWDASGRSSWKSPAPVTDASKLYVTKTGKKFHKGSCRYLSKSAIETTEASATAKGYGPCGSCLKGQSESSSKRTAVVSKGRCQATTKKGTQCKRKAKAGSRHCWQHQR